MKIYIIYIFLYIYILSLLLILFIDVPATVSQPFRNSFATPWHCAKQDPPELALSAKERERERESAAIDLAMLSLRSVKSCKGVATELRMSIPMYICKHMNIYIYIYMRTQTLRTHRHNPSLRPLLTHTHTHP